MKRNIKGCFSSLIYFHGRNVLSHLPAQGWQPQGAAGRALAGALWPAVLDGEMLPVETPPRSLLKSNHSTPTAKSKRCRQADPGSFPDQIPPWRLQEQHGCQVVLSEGLSPRHRHGALGAGMTPAVLSRLLLNTVRECGSAGGAQSEEILCCPGGSPAAPAWPSSVPVEVQVGYQRKSLLPKSSQHRAAAQEVLGSPSLGCSEPWGCGTVGCG